MTETAAPRMRAPRTLQIHVTRKCNLACLHCYSRSGPEETDALDPDALDAALGDAAALGFGFVSLSGGEPFLYPHLERTLRRAKTLGLRTGVVTNGMFLDARRLAPLAETLDICVVSLDGAPERHDRMRANPRAFATMARKLPALRASGIPFGFLLTLSRETVAEIDWAADFAADQGAGLLQIHPLDAEGRALDHPEIAGAAPETGHAIAAANAAADAQERLGGRLRIVVDYQPRRPGVAQGCGRSPGFADATHPLSIEPDGTIAPMGHGFPRSLAVGRLGERPLAEMAAEWMRDGRGAAYAALVARVRRAAAAEDAPPLANIARDIRAAARAPESSAA